MIDFPTSSSIVTTRPDGARPALHRRGATAGFYVTDAQINTVLDTKILHVGGVGLMDAMDQGRTVEILKEAKVRGCVTTLDVFAASQEDFTLIEPLLPFTDYFMPSEEEAMALTGLTNFEKVCSLLLEKGAKAVVLTLGADGAMYRDQTGLSFETPAYDLDVICTCGCGDCFNGGFATGLWSADETDSQQPETWHVRKKGHTASGHTTSAVNVLTRNGKAGFAFKSVSRTFDGQILPNIPEVIVTRQ